MMTQEANSNQQPYSLFFVKELELRKDLEMSEALAMRLCEAVWSSE